MTTLVWDKLSERRFETGLDRGVLYYPNGFGVPWNGLVSIVEKSDVTVEPLYFDSVKYNDAVEIGEFSATMSAYTYPDEFIEVEGAATTNSGLTLYNQPQKRFHLSYRTRVGNALDNEADYKIHVLYNLLAVPSDKTRSSITDNQDPNVFEWSITAIPVDIPNHRSTEHIAFDTRKVSAGLISRIEDILYGTELTKAFLPEAQFFMGMTNNWFDILSSAEVIDLAKTWRIK